MSWVRGDSRPSPWMVRTPATSRNHPFCLMSSRSPSTKLMSSVFLSSNQSRSVVTHGYFMLVLALLTWFYSCCLQMFVLWETWCWKQYKRQDIHYFFTYSLTVRCLGHSIITSVWPFPDLLYWDLLMMMAKQIHDIWKQSPKHHPSKMHSNVFWMHFKCRCTIMQIWTQNR